MLNVRRILPIVVLSCPYVFAVHAAPPDAPPPMCAPMANCDGHDAPMHPHGHSPRAGGEMPPPMMGPPSMMMAMMGVLHALTLTDAQHAQLKTIHEQTHSKMRALMMGDRATQSQVAITWPGEPGYEASIAAAKRNASEMIQLHSDAMAQIYLSVLTDAQRTQVTQLLASHRHRHHHDSKQACEAHQAAHAPSPKEEARMK